MIRIILNTKYDSFTSFGPNDSHTGEHDTVGAVAFDRQGNVSYATSTGGITGKLCGRVGDSPIVGKLGVLLLNQLHYMLYMVANSCNLCAFTADRLAEAVARVVADV